MKSQVSGYVQLKKSVSVNFVRSALTVKRFRRRYMYISGTPGSGKTATVHRVLKKLETDYKGKKNAFKVRNRYKLGDLVAVPG